jgi:hypothetical protein
MTAYYCGFCGKSCTTGPGLERHVVQTPDCKKASHEKFGQYANNMWNNSPAYVDSEQQQQANLPDFPDFHGLPDFQLDEDIQMAEEMFYTEDIYLPQKPLPLPQDEPPQQPQHATMEVPNNEEVNDGGRYIENFPEEYMAGATWGHCKPLFESLYEEQKMVGGSRWAPFEDEDEWQLAEWLIRNVGQKQTDTFLKLSIVSFFLPWSVIIFYQFID